MLLNKHTMTAMLALAAAALPAAAYAQASTSELMAMSVGALEGEIGQRYNAALNLTRDNGTVSADDPRYLWASQAKAQCGIALGFLKSRTKDPVSIGKCVDAALRMNQQRVVEVAPPPVVAAGNPACAEPIAGIVFFEWDSAMVPDSALPTIQAAAQNLTACGWRGLSVAGHTDRSGSDTYNDGLSRRRADAVAQLIASQGAAGTSVEVSSFGERTPKVPTVDGERNPQNRRVEITVKN
jgi:OmpA-OmpF porin, OOP family